MTLRDKVEIIMQNFGISSLKDFAVRLDVSYKNLSKNITDNKLTMEVAQAIKREFPDVDLNWLLLEEPLVPMLSEPSGTYMHPKVAIHKIKDLLSILEKGLEE